MGKNTFTKYTNYTVKELESYVADPNACVKKLEWTDMVSVLPKYLGDIREGVRSCLSQKIGTYDRKVDGIILAYKNTKILSPLSAIHPNSVRVYVKTRADFYVFRPQSGSIIGGTVRYVSSNYLSAVIYRVFNVTIKLQTQKIQNIARGKEINFVIKSYDMKSDLPSIEGELIPDKDSNQPQQNGNIKFEARQNGGTARIKSSVGSEDSEDSEPETQTVDHKPPTPPVKASKEQKSKKVKQEPMQADSIEEESIADEMDNSIRALLSTYEHQLNDSTETNGTNGTIKEEVVEAPTSSKKKKSKKKRKSQNIDALEAQLLQKFAAQCDEPDAEPSNNGHTNGEPSEEPMTPKAEKPRKRKKKKKHSNSDSADADEFEASIMSSLLKCAAEAEQSVADDDATPVRKSVKKTRKSVRFDDTIMEASFNTFDAAEQLEISQLPAPNLSSTLK
uniref:Putative dna-dependent rna polymerase i n=1 Tax=Culex tarsalis TaxID=7177 RepID=A0A1Q3F3W5_CULTA